MEVLLRQAELLSALGAAVLLFSLLPALGSCQKLFERRIWRKRLDLRIALPGQSRPGLRIRSVLDQIELGVGRLYRTGPGRIVFHRWCAAGFGSKPSLFTLSWLGIIAAGGFIYRFTALNITLSAFIILPTR